MPEHYKTKFKLRTALKIRQLCIAREFQWDK